LEDDGRERMMTRIGWQALKVTAIYFAFGVAWILLSDWAILAVLPTPSQQQMAQTAKGLLYILITCALLYGLVYRSLRSLQGSLEALTALEHDRALELERSNRVLEDQVRDRTRHLEEANERLTAFNYVAAHDLKSPLRTIVGFSEILREDHAASLGGEGVQLVERIEAATARLRALVDDLLSLSMVSAACLQRKEVDLSRVAEAVAADLAAGHPGRTVVLQVEPGLRAMADESLARDVLHNLLDNAWKYTKPVAEAAIEVGSETIEGTRWFYVRDNGVGFDPDQAGRVFDPFVRLHGQHEFPGTGIGLATVARIVQRHGGVCRAESGPEGGATIWFHFGPADA
jgi:signal transduction histidine kinase